MFRKFITVKCIEEYHENFFRLDNSTSKSIKSFSNDSEKLHLFDKYDEGDKQYQLHHSEYLEGEISSKLYFNLSIKNISLL